MNREILFRGRKKGGTEWFEGDLSYLVHDKRECYIFPPDGYNSPDWYEVDPATVGQYTGMPDKSGRKIFEGDILENSVGCFIVQWNQYFVVLGAIRWEQSCGTGSDRAGSLETAGTIRSCWRCHHMTDIEVLERQMECVRRKAKINCTNCGSCDLLMDDSRILAAYSRAIDALRAQQETKSPCQVCGYGGRHLDAPHCAPSLGDSGCPAHPKLLAKEAGAPCTL